MNPRNPSSIGPRYRIALALILLVGFVWMAAWSWTGTPRRLVMTTGQQDATYFPMGKLISEAVAENESSIAIEVIQSSGSLQNMERLANGQADLAIVQNDTEGPSSVRTLMPLHHGVLHFLSRRDSEIKSVIDLAGKRVSLGLPDSGSRRVVDRLLRHFGIDERVMQVNDDPLHDACEQLIDGDLDAVFFMASVDSQAARDLVACGQVDYVSLASTHLPGNEMDGFAVGYPYVVPYTIPVFMHEVPGSLQGAPSRPCVTFSIRSSLICRADLPYEVARSIVAATIRNRPRMMRQDQAAAEINESFQSRDVHFPMHDGAGAFYERKSPGFLERYSETMAFLLSALLFCYGLASGIHRWLVRTRKNRIDVYYSRLDALLAELDHAALSEQQINEIDLELETLRRHAVSDLVNERLTADESFRIFQSLLADCRHQVMNRQQTFTAT